MAQEKAVTLLVCGITREKGLWQPLSRGSVTHDLLTAVAGDGGDVDVYLGTY